MRAVRKYPPAGTLFVSNFSHRCFPKVLKPFESVANALCLEGRCSRYTNTGGTVCGE